MASYLRAIMWIAENDNENLSNLGTGYITSVCLVADLFKKPQEIVVRDVNTVRCLRTTKRKELAL